MTRRIRMLFKRADNLEADVHCGIVPKGDKGEPVADDKEPSVEDLEAAAGVSMPTTDADGPHNSLQFLTWRLPAGVNFSYSSLPVRSRVHQGPTRTANPFGNMHANLREQKVQSPDVVKWRQTVGPIQTPGVDSSQILDQSEPSPTTEERAEQQRDEPKVVVNAHPKKMPWDDTPRLDRPYMNPYYATALDNFLWLPSNPFGPLDLDESVDMHRSLTSELHAGKIGVWLNDAPTVAGPVITIDSATSASETEAGTSGGTVTRSTIRREISGLETIVGLPQGIERRARVERDIEAAEGAHLTVGRSGTIRLRATPEMHSSRHDAEHGRPSRPKVYREMDTGGQGRTGGESMISAREAVLGEILVEEQLANEARLRREQAEEQATTSGFWRWTRG